MSVSVSLSMTEVHCGRGACREEGRGHLALCWPLLGARPSCYKIVLVVVEDLSSDEIGLLRIPSIHSTTGVRVIT